MSTQVFMLRLSPFLQLTCAIVVLIAVDGTRAEQPAASGSREVSLPYESSNGISFSADSKKLLIVGRWQAIVVDTTMWKTLASFHHGNAAELARNLKWYPSVGESTVHRDEMSSAVFDSAGNRVLTFARGEAIVWDIETGKPIGAPIRHKDKRATSVAISPDGRTVATSRDEDSSVHLWNVDSGKIERTFEHDHPIDDVQFDPAGTTLVASGKEFIKKEWWGYVTVLWDLKSARRRAKLPINWPDHRETKPTLSAKGHIAVATISNFDVFDIATGKLLHHTSNPSRGNPHASFLSISADGSLVASAVKLDKGVWDPKTDKRILDLSLYNPPAFDPTNATLAVPGLESDAGIWDLKTGRRIRQFDKKYSSSAAYSPDGSRLAISFSTSSRVLFAQPDKSGAERWKEAENAPFSRSK